MKLTYNKWYPIQEYFNNIEDMDWALVQFKETKTGFMPLPIIAEYKKKAKVWMTATDKDRYLCEMCEPVAFMLWEPYELHQKLKMIGDLKEKELLMTVPKLVEITTIKSYEPIEFYERDLKRLKKLLQTNKDFVVESIEYVEEDVYVKEKLKVKINTHHSGEAYHDLIVLFYIDTEYEVWDGYKKIIMRMEPKDIEKDVKKVIEEVLKSNNG